eukprot:TRINITY_DN102450_c0_g1_i1.p1 TRINITY_DN102450_c0_g1~~TRINITY_DN102450_c0_g1_i1.p1  ORF type:complete len:410 (+),score=58.72 TRINITY_DN102450_c0_g1_i1:86-1315(+)
MSYKRAYHWTQEQDHRPTRPRLLPVGNWNTGRWNRGRHAGQYLVIMDMNGVLMKRSGSGNSNVTMRPHLDEFLKVLSELSESFSVAVWSSMMMHNLLPMVNSVFGKYASNLQFIWDQNSCTKCWVPEMRKPLFRKDLAWLLTTEWAGYMPNRVLLIDDDAIKCTENPEGTAVHPSSFEGELEGDDELLHLAEYLKFLAETADNSIPAFVTSYPFDAFKAGAAMPNGQLEDYGTGEAANDLVEVEVEDDRHDWASDHEAGQCEGSGPIDAADDLVEVEIEEGGEDWNAQHGEVPIEGEENQDCAEREMDKFAGAQQGEEPFYGDDHADAEVADDFAQGRNCPSHMDGNPWSRLESRSKPGTFYYFNSSTGESQMEPPPPWEKRMSRHDSGTYYYWNPMTGETSVDKPDMQ